MWQTTGNNARKPADKITLSSADDMRWGGGWAEYEPDGSFTGVASGGGKVFPPYDFCLQGGQEDKRGGGFLLSSCPPCKSIPAPRLIRSAQVGNTLPTLPAHHRPLRREGVPALRLLFTKRTGGQEGWVSSCPLVLLVNQSPRPGLSVVRRSATPCRRLRTPPPYGGYNFCLQGGQEDKRGGFPPVLLSSL